MRGLKWSVTITFLGLSSMLTEDIDEMFNTFIEFNITDSFCFLKTEVRSCEINCNYFILLIPYF